MFSKGNLSNSTIGEIIIEENKSKIKVSEAKDANGKYPFFTSGKSILSYPDYLVDGFKVYLNTGGNADVKFYSGKAAYSTDTWCISEKRGYTAALYIVLRLLLPEIESTCFEGSALQHLQKNKLKSIAFYMPNDIKFHDAINHIFDQISSNLRENNSLSSIRDALLPKLMSGEIDVSDITI